MLQNTKIKKVNLKKKTLFCKLNKEIKIKLVADITGFTNWELNE